MTGSRKRGKRSARSSIAKRPSKAKDADGLGRLIRDARRYVNAQQEHSFHGFKKERGVFILVIDNRRQSQKVINVNKDDHSTTYGTKFQGKLIVQGNMENAFNTINNIGASATNKDFGARLKDLHKVVAELIKELPEDEAERVSRDLKSFVDEVTSKKPRESIFKVTADGLLEAAKTVAKMAEPVTTAVKAVLALLVP